MQELPSYNGLRRPISPVESFLRSIGFKFTAGLAGGSIFHFSRGVLRSSPGVGPAGRLASGLAAAHAGAFPVAGTTVALGTLALIVSRAVHVNGEHTPRGPVSGFIGGSVAGAVVFASRGPRAALTAALTCGTLYSLSRTMVLWYHRDGLGRIRYHHE